MRSQSTVQIRTPAGLVDAPCYYQWKQEIVGIEFEFALHIAAGYAKGFMAPLAISELSTGFDVKADLHTAGHKLTTSNVVTLQPRIVKKMALAALHHLIYKKVGPIRFMQAMLGAQMQLAKVDLGKYEVGGDATVTYQNDALLDKLRTPGLRPPVMLPTTTNCLACEDTKVLADAPCTECIPAPLNHPIEHWTSPTEEEWIESLDPVARLEHLINKRGGLMIESKRLSAIATKADYDRIDDMDDEIRALDKQIATLNEEVHTCQK